MRLPAQETSLCQEFKVGFDRWTQRTPCLHFYPIDDFYQVAFAIAPVLCQYANQSPVIDIGVEPALHEPVTATRRGSGVNVLMVAAELAPYTKTGGLGDVMEALPRALARLPDPLGRGSSR